MPRRFRYPLEPLLRVRKMQEEERKRAFAKAQGELVTQEHLLWSLLTEEARHTSEIAALRQGTLSLFKVRAHEAYGAILRRRIWSGREELVRRAQILERRRIEMAEARKAVRLLERLRERRKDAWEGEVLKEEQRDLDEIGQRAFWRES